MTSLAALLLPLGSTGIGAAPAKRTTVPAGASFSFRLDAPLSSNRSKKDEQFSFTTATAIDAGGSIVVATGARGTGTVLLAGSAGSKGHEGDLTFRLDEVTAVPDGQLVFTNQRISINGRNRKITSGALSIVPIFGLGAFFIPGKNIVIGTSTVIRTVLVTAGHFADVSASR